MQAVVVLVALVLLGRLAWQGVKYLRRAPSASASSNATVPSPASLAGSKGAFSSTDPFLREILVSLDQAAQSAGAGSVSEAEVDTDRAGSILVSLRLESHTAPPGFFDAAAAMLDRVVGAHRENAGLVEHVTETYVELAELRSALNSPTPDVAELPSAATSGSPPAALSSSSGARASLEGPRQIAAQFTFDPATARASYLDATQMADTAEMLMPPITRSFSDGVRVENLTLAGAAQTLDGIRWRNVTFIGTHLRYEGGPLDLRNVRFVRCRFGFVSDARGQHLANIIALGQTSLTLE